MTDEIHWQDVDAPPETDEHTMRVISVERSDDCDFCASTNEIDMTALMERLRDDQTLRLCAAQHFLEFARAAQARLDESRALFYRVPKGSVE